VVRSPRGGTQDFLSTSIQLFPVSAAPRSSLLGGYHVLVLRWSALKDWHYQKATIDSDVLAGETDISVFFAGSLKRAACESVPLEPELIGVDGYSQPQLFPRIIHAPVWHNAITRDELG